MHRKGLIVKKKKLIPMTIIGLAAYAVSRSNLFSSASNKRIIEKDGCITTNKDNNKNICEMSEKRFKVIKKQANRNSKKDDYTHIYIGNKEYILNELKLQTLQQDGWWLLNDLDDIACDNEIVLRHDEIPFQLYVYCGDRSAINCLSINAVSDDKSDFSCVTIRNSIKIGSSESDITKELGEPVDVVNMIKYGYKLLIYRNEKEFIVFNVDKIVGLKYVSISIT